jgi:hypothetical protein
VWNWETLNLEGLAFPFWENRDPRKKSDVRKPKAGLSLFLIKDDLFIFAFGIGTLYNTFARLKALAS